MDGIRRFFFLALFLIPSFLFSQKTYNTSRLFGKPPLIDGSLNEECWDRVEWGSGFVQREPFDGKSPSQNTEFRILYDDNNIYVGIRAFDSVPSEIVKRLSRRDNTDSDWVGIIFDSYDDNLTGFGFAITASGVKMDLMIVNDGTDDATWDALWLAKSQTDEKGYTAEFRIPLSQLRFADKEELSWGLNVFRYIYRKKEMSLWQPIERNAPGFVSRFGELKGIRGIHPKKDIELLPYMVTQAEYAEEENGNPFATGHRYRASAGLDGKIALTNDLTLNFTINPDFGQVEADPSVVNLTAFESYFEEKRPFFIEGKNIYDFRLTGGDGDDTRNMLFYSRRIGRPPHRELDLREGEYADVPGNTHILGSFKVSGKTKKGLSIGIMESVTRKEMAEFEYEGTRRKEVIEPLTNYFVARVQQDYNKGVSSLGGMITSVNRSISESYLEFLPKAAYSGGLDYSHTWKSKTYYFDVKVVGSQMQGSKEAITDLQKSSARYFQSPDKKHVKLDTTRTSLSGYGFTFDIGKAGNGHFNYMAWITARSPGLEFNDLGYMRYSDEIQQVIWVGYREYKPKKGFNSYGLNFNQWSGFDFSGKNIYNGGNINGFAQLKNYWNLNFGTNFDMESLDRAQLRGGPALLIPGGMNAWMFLGTDSRKKWILEANAYTYHGFESYIANNGFYIGGTFKPWNSFSFTLSPNYSWGYNELQYVTDLSLNGEPRYILARLDQKSLGVSIRFDYTITPDLTVQFYGQPFLFSGSYSKYRRVTDPKAESYANRYKLFEEGTNIRHNDETGEWEISETGNGMADYTFSNDDFNFLQFRSNLVLRWEYRPGSSLYLVWSQGRTEDTSYGNFRFHRDITDLFDAHPQDVLLVKVSYMLVF